MSKLVDSPVTGVNNRRRVEAPTNKRKEKMLTPKQTEVLQHAANGLDIKETAKEMWLATVTVKFHRTQIFFALDAKNITHAVAIGYQKGILT